MLVSSLLNMFHFTANPDYIQDAAIPMDLETHGAEDVGVYAQGPMSFLLSGTYEQSYIAHVMMYAACIGPNKANCQTSAGQKHMGLDYSLWILPCLLLGAYYQRTFSKFE